MTTIPDVQTAESRALQLAARLLLEYNLRAERLEYQLRRLAAHLRIEAQIHIAYRHVTIVADGRTLTVQAPELRINVAVSLGTLNIIDALCADRIGLDEGLRRLESIERTATRHARWLLVLIFGLGAAALAWLLGADRGAIAVSGVSSALGLIARQELGKRRAALLVLPFTGALIGAALAGVATRLGWTQTAGLALTVPALMLVPGPHAINGVADILENYLETGVSRLVLASAILVSAALGGVLGGWLTLHSIDVPAATAATTPIPLLLDIGLAGVAACAFGAFYNAPWRVLWISIACGVVGHGIRWLCLSEGMSVTLSTSLACAAIGVMANIAAERLRLPFSAISFAGAVPMMPGVFMYQSLAGAIQLGVAGQAADPARLAVTVALIFKAAFVVIGMVIGLLAGARLTRWHR